MGVLADPGVDADRPRRRFSGAIHRRRLQLHAVEQPREKLHAVGRLPERATADITLKKLCLRRLDPGTLRRSFGRGAQKSRAKRKRELANDLRGYLSGPPRRDLPVPPSD